ncbi:O-antigen ligase [Frigoribacterium sp. VKM Ac-2836]|uniref:O-antigen ligase family protein n=1 Tax=Frigoribacterium sp. VKM Ac-2836 TaxID=2739014 RepID=UPI001567AE9E|nr:O-antigen ligase family protein [Frigoribacterium sp. VKM Ac-2836]NRD27277.1 O-antigen ligase family protein [Frigoribacterium sp. VKM Ac-2836]
MNRGNLLLIGGACVLAAGVTLAVTASPLIATGLAIILCLAIALMKYPWMGIAFLAVYLPFNGVVSSLLVKLGQAQFATVFGAAKDGVLILLFVLVVFSPRIARVRPELFIIVLTIVGLGAVSGIGSSNVEQAAYGWRNDFLPLLLIIIVPAVLDRVNASRISTVVVVAGQGAGIVAIATWSRGIEWLYVLGRLPVPEGERFPSSLFSANSIEPRAFSPFSAPNEMAVGFLIIMSFIWMMGDRKFGTRIALSVLPVVAIVLSESRSGLLGLACLAVVVVCLKLRDIRPGVALAFASISGVAIGLTALAYVNVRIETGNDPSIGGHAASLRESLQLLVQHPLGIGLGQVGPRALRYDDNPVLVESFLLLLALESGPLVLVLYLALAGRIVSLAVKEPRAGAAHLGLVAIAASLVSQIVLPTMQDGAVSYLLWIAVGIGLLHGQKRPGAGETDGVTSSGDAAFSRPESVLVGRR